MHETPGARRVWTATDAGLLTTAVLWGVNYSVIKVVLRKMPPLAFSALRMAIACTVFLAAIAVSRWLRLHARGLREQVVKVTPGGQDSLAIFRTSSLTGHDWWRLVLLGLVGHAGYQVLFIEGLARTSVANASLIIGCVPIFVALASAAIGQERLGPAHWIGTALSLTGVYLVVGGAGLGIGAAQAGAGSGAHANAGVSADAFAGHVGDLLILASAWCWAAYTLLGRPLLRRHSPLTVTGYSMAAGTVMYLPYSATSLARTPWQTIDAGDWSGVAFSALLALNVGYVLWYAGVQRLGSARTAVYSNLVPIAALLVATVWLREPLGWVKLSGAAAVIAGLALTRLKPSKA
jgi:drug/metabolite transporter (DMT)-like permease